jgi:hypothetical protein
MSIQSHDGLTTWISLRIPASVSADVYYRFGEAGILVPGAFRFLWTADTPGGAGPALYTAFYQDLVERLVN